MAVTAWDQNKNSVIGDGSKIPIAASQYSNQRGVIDYGNLAQFAPYQSGYAFLAVIGVPRMMTTECADDGRQELLDIFVSVLEKEFKSLSGISDMQGDTLELTDNITSMSLLTKTNQDTSVQINLQVQEKTGTPITKFISTFMRYLHDPKTQVTTYGGFAISQKQAMENSKAGLAPAYENEVFTLLYGVTDSSMLNIEKAFMIMNAQPTTANFSDLFEYERGSIDFKNLTVTMNGFLVDGELPNKIAQAYVDTMVNNTKQHSDKAGKINVNSFAMDWSYADQHGDIKKISDLEKRSADEWQADYETGFKKYFSGAAN